MRSTKHLPAIDAVDMPALRERVSGTHWIGGWVGRRKSLEDVEKNRTPAPLPASESLYWLRYPFDKSKGSFIIYKKSTFNLTHSFSRAFTDLPLWPAPVQINFWDCDYFRLFFRTPDGWSTHHDAPTFTGQHKRRIMGTYIHPLGGITPKILVGKWSKISSSLDDR
jgi:hypothetical protein